MTNAATDETPDPQTAERVRTHEKFEKSMDEHGLLKEDGGIALEPEEARYPTRNRANRRLTEAPAGGGANAPPPGSPKRWQL